MGKAIGAKVLTVGVMAGGVLLFFLFDLRTDDTE